MGLNLSYNILNFLISFRRGNRADRDRQSENRTFLELIEFHVRDLGGQGGNAHNFGKPR